MSVENVAKFCHEVLKDNALRDRLKDVNEETLTKQLFESMLLPEAKNKGYDFTYEEVREYYKKQGEKTELTMDELEGVSGGGCSPKTIDIVEEVRKKIREGKAKQVQLIDSPKPLCPAFVPRLIDCKYACGNCRNCKDVGDTGKYYCEASCW